MPKRLLSVKRLYSVGQYQNIEFKDEISELDTEIIPSEVAYKINLLQVLGMEKMINKYLALRGTIVGQGMTAEQAIGYLDEQGAEVIKDLQTILPENATHTIEIKGDK